MTKNVEAVFEEVAQKWVDDAYITSPSKIPELVYHYTDAAGLIGMLQSNKIWATDYRFLNDKSEVGHTRKAVRSIVSTALGSCKDETCAKFYREILAYQEVESTADSYVFSLSEEGDDLGQWRGYAKEGYGFTVGFCGNSIYEPTEEEADYSFLKIEYNQAEQIAVMKRAMKDFESKLKYIEKDKDIDIDDAADKAANWFDWLVEIRAVGNKHGSFRLEREWRIVGAVPVDDAHGEVRIRASGPRLVRYIELSLGKKPAKKLPVRRIGIGPGFQGTEEVHAVKALCRENGYEPEVYFADTPYRRL
jgi:hypothetical protein